MTTITTMNTATTPTTTNAPQRRRAEITIVSDTEVRISREFDAPARLVFEASTRPEYLARWYGCSQMTMIRCEADLREGGEYYRALRSTDGSEHHFRGVYRQLEPPTRAVYTEAYLLGDTWTSDLINDVTMDERDGKTLLTVRLIYATKMDRDGHLGSGMERGMHETHARLDALLAELVRSAA
jgi:uncharacterized protein YndB with AHSA1/START domain